MKASGLSFAILALAAFVAAPAHAGPHFAPRPPVKLGPRPGEPDRDHHRRVRNDGVLLGWDEGPTDAPDPAPAPPQMYTTQNVYVAAPAEPVPARRSGPRLILIGVRGPAAPLPQVIYGAPRP
jgi:hypothetical protein